MQTANCKLQTVSGHFAVCSLQFAVCSGFLLILGWLLFFRGLSERDLWSSHEGRAAMDAQALLDDGIDTMPRLFDGRAEVQKPPLYYWLVALAARAARTDVDAWAVRLPSAVAGLAGVLLLFGFAARRGRPVTGFVAAVVLATALHYTWLARVGRIDMPLTLTTAVALLAFNCAGDEAPPRRRLRNLMIAYLALAAGLLLKGPIGAVLPLGVAGAWLLLNREVPRPWHVGAWIRLPHRYGAWWGLPLVALIVGPVYLWANARTGGEFFRVFLWHHNVERGFGGSEVLRAHPWWFYFPHLVADFLPWSLFLPVAAWAFARRGWWRDDPEARFGLVWLVTILLLLSAARFKRADYLLPAFPGAALFLGCAVERWRRPAVLLGVGSVAAACAAGWWLYLDHDLRTREPARDSTAFAEAVRRVAPAPQPILFFRTEAHAAAFHVGRPLALFVEWEKLDAWAARPEPAYVVMPARVAAECHRFVHSGRLEEVLREPAPGSAYDNWQLPEWLPARWRRDLERFQAGEGHERPLVLLRTVPPREPADAGPDSAASHRRPAPQRRPAGAQRGAAP
jgi:4-amino-4-deoxy-L-arabinose transferase-like glycosyltransferase